MARLQFLGSELLGREVELANGEHRVGRAPDNAVVINDASVSRHHCLLLVHGREVIARELGSHNGTWVNGQKVTGQRVVETRQVLRFGQVEARLLLGPEDRLSDTTTLSATHGFVRFLKREAELRPHRAAPASPVGKLAEPETKVITVAPSASPAAVQIELTAAPTGTKRTRGRRLTLAAWVTLIVTLIALLAWLSAFR